MSQEDVVLEAGIPVFEGFKQLVRSFSPYYRDARDHSQDEFTGELGDRPYEHGTREHASLGETYSFSVDVGARWEDVFFADALPCTKRVPLLYLVTL